MNAYELYRLLESYLREGIISKDMPVLMECGYEEYSSIGYIEEQSGNAVLIREEEN